MIRHHLARWLCAVVLPLVASGASNAAVVLSQTSTFADIAISGPGCQPPTLCTAEDEDPLFASVQIGNTWTQADATAGVIRAVTEASGDATGVPSGAGTGATVEIKLLNTGSSAVLLPAGALVFNVDSRFMRSLGLFSGTTVAASLAYGSDPTNTASVTFQYQFFDVFVPGSGTVTLTQNTIGGAAIDLRSATAELVDFSLSSGALSIQPGDELSASFLFQPTVVATGAGAFAQIDSTQTASFSLRLPPGVVFDANGLDVAWVSVVPEAPSPALLAAGLGVIACAAWRRQRVR